MRRRTMLALAGSLLLADGKYSMKASDTTGKETDDDLFIASSKTLKVGTVASPASLTKTLRIPCSEIVPVDDTQPFVIFSGGVYIANRTANNQIVIECSVVLPVGVMITAFRARFRLNAVSDTANAVLYRLASDAATSIATLTSVTTGWATLSASLSQLVSTGQHFSVEVTLNGANAQDGRLGWVELDYTMPSYDKGI